MNIYILNRNFTLVLEVSSSPFESEIRNIEAPWKTTPSQALAHIIPHLKAQDMFSFIKRKFSRFQAHRTFHEYGYKVKNFSLANGGEVEYAQWLHPLEGEKAITKDQVDFYKNFTKPGGLVIDIGAHTGDTTVPMSLAVGKDGLVLALEPNKYVFKILKKNAELNPSLTRIIPLPFAATETDGEFVFNYSDASFCNGGFLSEIQNTHHHHNYELKIVGKNLEKFIHENYNSELKNLQLIKIDAEGYDKEIIKTIPTLISKYKPTMLVECYKRLTQGEREELFDVISQHGYELFYTESFDNRNNREKIERQDMMKRTHFDMIAVPK